MLNLATCCILAYSDASPGDTKDSKGKSRTQGGYAMFLVDYHPALDRLGRRFPTDAKIKKAKRRANLLSFSSKRIAWVVNSTLASETVSLAGLRDRIFSFR